MQETKNKKDAFIIIIIAVAIFTTGTILYNYQSQTPAETPNNNKEATTSSQDQKEKLSLVIDFGDKKETFSAQFIEQATAYDFLKRAAQEKNLTLKTKEYDFGTLITQIGPKKNNQAGKSWTFYINDEMAKQAADKTNLNPGDKVEFRYQESPF